MKTPDLAPALRARVLAAGARDPRFVLGETRSERVRAIGRTVVRREIAVLERGAAIVVYFDPTDRIIGWRDEGRLGSGEEPPNVDPEPVRVAVIRELRLGPATRLGRIRAALLPPAGWTVEAVLFPGPDPAPSRVLRVWCDPRTHGVIQCLFGPPD